MGTSAGTISGPYGEPADASSANALTGRIAVMNVLDNKSTASSITVCRLSRGCTRNLKSANMFRLAGVAMDNSGNCWASATLKYTNLATLTYFARCAGKGIAATGFKNATAGGLDVEPSGYLVSIDYAGGMNGQVWVYSGCNPACRRVGGPLPLQGTSSFGHLNHFSEIGSRSPIGNITKSTSIVTALRAFRTWIASIRTFRQTER